MSHKKKFLWVGDDYRSTSGYGRVARELLPFLKDYSIYFYAIGYRGQSKLYQMIDSNDGTSFGFKHLPKIMDIICPDITILLSDHKIIRGWLESIKQNCSTTHKNIIPYVCTEYIGVTPDDISIYNETTDRLLVMANFTIDEFKKRGYQYPMERLSHGYVETIKLMDKKEAKTKLGIDPATFVFFSGSKNQPRKRLDIIIRAFIEFIKDKQDEKILLMMNCGMIDSGWNLYELYTRLCLENKIINPSKHIFFCSNNRGDSNKNDHELEVIYNAADVGVTTSTGESFGLIPFEQSALGVPQIIPNWSGIIESCRYGCIKVETNDFYVYPICLQSAGGEARTVYYKDVAAAMNKYFSDKDLYKKDCELVKKNIEGYSWDKIAEKLLGFLKPIKSNKSNSTEKNQVNLSTFII